ncbi:MAG TPA: hypothetical protein EYP14_12090 [Planctomycetaceae bacterium]|nr:hypothetical protein [Planctomycetaceae bacterium]
MQEPSKSRRIPCLVITASGELYGEDTPENRELARRIRACVNACEGIPTEELERGIIRDMRRVLEMAVPLLTEQKKSA